MALQRWRLRINGREHEFASEPDTPLLYLLQDDAGLKGPRFGCGLAQCGACSVLVDDHEQRACVTPVSSVAGRNITTLEGLPAWHARNRKLNSDPPLHPVQQALIDEQAPQCGFCMNGMVIKAAELLHANPAPSDDEIRAAMDGHLCRCGTYPSILRAIRRAAGA